MAMSQNYDKDAFLAEQEPHMRVRFEALHDNQDKVDELLDAFAAERIALELKYRSLCGTLPWLACLACTWLTAH